MTNTNGLVNMKFTKTFALAAFAFVAFIFVSTLSETVMAQNSDDDWVLMASNNNGLKWYGKRNSGIVGTLDKKYKDIVITYKKTSSSSDKVELGELFAKVNDCERGEGTIYYGNMDGKPTAHDQFVVYGGSIASGLAEAVCASWDGISGAKTVQQVKSDSMWINVSNTNNTIFDVKKGSGRISKENNRRYAYATLKESYKGEDKIVFEKASVSEQSCKDGQGEIFYSDIDYAGKYSDNFVKNGGNADSSIAEALCTLFDKKG
jgi:hypothetical protein